METSREDVGIAVRSAFLRKGTQQRFSLFALVTLSIIFLFAETIETQPLNYLRSFIKDVIYRGSIVVSYPTKVFKVASISVQDHINIYDENGKLLTSTLHYSDVQNTYTPVLPFSYVRRNSDYSRSFSPVFSLQPGEKIFGCGESFTI